MGHSESIKMPSAVAPSPAMTRNRMRRGQVKSTLKLSDFVTDERSREILKETMESASRYAKKAEEERKEQIKATKKAMEERKKILEEKNKIALENAVHRQREKEKQQKTSETAIKNLIDSRKRRRDQT